MATKPDEAKAALLEKAVARVREKLPAGEARDAEAFLRHYYAHVPAEDLAARSAADLYGAALAHWNLLQERRPGEAKVHVYTPRFDEHGWQSTHSVVETVTDDMPFLVDSVGMALAARGSALHLVIHPIVRVRRDAEGRLVELVGPDGDAPDALSESLIHAEFDRETDPGTLAAVRDDVARVLADVRAAVEDWQPMRQRVRELAARLDERPPPVDSDEVAETKALLEWLAGDHYTFLGYREYELVQQDGEDVLRSVPGSGLGILRDRGEPAVSVSFAKLPPEVRRVARAKTLLNLTKANSRATVHRPSYLDYIGVKTFDDAGEVTGEGRFLGLYTTSAYSASPWEIPVVRRKVQRVLERSGFAPGGHDHKALRGILEDYPRDSLFQISDDELYEIALGIHHLGERQQVRLFVRRDPFGRFVSCLVFVPRDRYDTDTRRRIQQILQDAFGGVSVDFDARLSESVLARAQFVIYTEPDRALDYDVDEIEARIAEATRSWRDDLRDALIEELGEERGSDFLRRYADAFPGAYRDDVPARAAVADVERLERLAPAGDLAMALSRPLEAAPGHFRFKLLRSGQPLLLSDVLPLLENMGVRVVDERPYEVRPAERPPLWIYDFGLFYPDGGELDTDQVRQIFQDAFARVWRGEVENDGFNRLVLAARLTAREITLLRAVSKYLRQGGSTFSQAYMEGALSSHPEIAALLVRLFHARFDPGRADGALAEADRLAAEVERALDGVASLDEDRILRSFLAVILAALRTNYFQRGPEAQPKPYLSLKLDPTSVPDLPEPRPMFEVFVYSPRTEGVHLRGGPVARGGIRWSDRREDFRTEVLGLMKAQMVKNAVIVPVGAKGGFVVKQPPAGADRDALQAEVVECYRTLIRGLLDVTDNLVAGEVVPPPEVVRYDGDDPYLVVAADKGTATFSDLANALSQEYGFWLGDAFASGGSAGYDHKKMGITARGAWESVKRHFRELGTDVQTTDFTVAGIGDMSGDVFGNGMLLSRHVRLVGAFDHRHLFLDPDPDPEASFRERERLFALPRSSWADYDAGLISPGGGVFPRTAKSIPLSPEVRALLGAEAEALPPNEVIRALLTAPVDLLWNGGIGTFVKARAESHAEVGDKASDPIRVDAEDLRCRVVGEGGNLGFTQRARVAFALRGGRIYTDAIDNSAGVDTSDHEVNIKILLDAVVAEGDLTEKQRNALLAEMTDEVAARVLRDNYEQTQAISAAVTQAASMVDVHARYLRSLEQAGKLDRALEFLPGDEALAERKAAGGGLTAPEFAVVLAYTKIALAEQLLASDVPEDPYLSRELERYFPAPVGERLGDALARHRLRREIVTAQIVNAVVNRAGTSFSFRLGEETGAAPPDIARAFTVAREVFGLGALWAEIEALDNLVPAQTQLAMLLRTRRLLERATRWLLRNRARPLEIAPTVAHLAPAVAALTGAVPTLLAPSEHETAERAAEELVAAGVPAAALAARVSYLEAVFPALDVADVATAAGAPVDAVAEVYFALGARLELHWLRDRIGALPREARWEALARRALWEDVFGEQRALTAAVVVADAELPPCERVEAWLERHRAPVERCLEVLAEIKAGASFDLATLSVAVREIRSLIQATTAPGPVPAGPPVPAEAVPAERATTP